MNWKLEELPSLTANRCKSSGRIDMPASPESCFCSWAKAVSIAPASVWPSYIRTPQDAQGVQEMVINAVLIQTTKLRKCDVQLQILVPVFTGYLKKFHLDLEVLGRQIWERTAMASNLYTCDGLQPTCNGLQPNCDGLQPTFVQNLPEEKIKYLFSTCVEAAPFPVEPKSISDCSHQQETGPFGGKAVQRKKSTCALFSPTRPKNRGSRRCRAPNRMTRP